MLREAIPNYEASIERFTHTSAADFVRPCPWVWFLDQKELGIGGNVKEPEELSARQLISRGLLVRAIQDLRAVPG
jgi:hypothetical protein